MPLTVTALGSPNGAPLGVLACLCKILDAARVFGDGGSAVARSESDAEATIVSVPACVSVPYTAAVLCAVRSVASSRVPPSGISSCCADGSPHGISSSLVVPLTETVCALWRLRRHIIAGDVDESSIEAATGIVGDAAGRVAHWVLRLQAAQRHPGQLRPAIWPPSQR